MTPEEDALRRVIEALQHHDVPYMLTGSVAASYHGRPRATHDSDIVIDPSGPQAERLVADLREHGFYVDADAARAAVAQRRLFNVIDVEHACKIDLIVRKDRPFSREEFSRRQRVTLPFANDVAVVTPEDAVLSKLEWALLSGESERQLRDVAGILELNPGIDRAYIRRWVGPLGVGDLWTRVDQ